MSLVQEAQLGAELRELTARVAAAYFETSRIPPSQIAEVIGRIASSLRAVGTAPEPFAEPAAPPPVRATASEIRRSITREALISFEDGRPYRTLKRHLSRCGLTPDQYRTKWGLPADYPMTAAGYSAARAEVARKIGLGRQGLEARRAGRK